VTSLVIEKVQEIQKPFRKEMGQQKEEYEAYLKIREI
jgi:hypothetical protein